MLPNNIINRLISVAPMMDCTDRHERYFLRLISPHALLYTEMVVASALKYKNRDKLLQYHPFEKPLALQLGGSDLNDLVLGAKLAEEYGYTEVNLNVGCPSDRVQSGKFGACLMLEPDRVAACVAAMQAVVKIPVTVKCRIGVDAQDHFSHLQHFVDCMAQAGCKTIIIHARKAILKGLTPKENRNIPPLKYDYVYQIKKIFPQLEIILNGGIKNVQQVQHHLQYVDGIMIGREAYANPYFLAEIEKSVFKQNVLTREMIVEKFIPYFQEQLAYSSTKLNHITRHMLGLFHGQPGGRLWRQSLTQMPAVMKGRSDEMPELPASIKETANSCKAVNIIYDALKLIKEMNHAAISI